MGGIGREISRVGERVKREFKRTDPAIITGVTFFAAGGASNPAAGDVAKGAGQAQADQQRAEAVKKRGRAAAAEILKRVEEEVALIRQAQRFDRRNLRRQVAAILGAQRAEFGAAGVTGGGTPALVALQTIADQLTQERQQREQASLQVRTARERAARTAASIRRSAEQEASALDSRALTGALLGGLEAGAGQFQSLSPSSSNTSSGGSSTSFDASTFSSP